MPNNILPPLHFHNALPVLVIDDWGGGAGGALEWRWEGSVESRTIPQQECVALRPSDIDPRLHYILFLRLFLRDSLRTFLVNVTVRVVRTLLNDDVHVLLARWGNELSLSAFLGDFFERQSLYYCFLYLVSVGRFFLADFFRLIVILHRAVSWRHDVFEKLIFFYYWLEVWAAWWVQYALLVAGFRIVDLITVHLIANDRIRNNDVRFLISFARFNLIGICFQGWSERAI